MSPTFSIIVPVYNTAPYLRECLDSLLAQTFAGWEAICIDDGSTDGSAAILNEYSSKDERIRVARQANSGVGAARNLGLDMAVGEYVTFLDGDDAYAPFWLESFHELIESTRADLVRLRQIVWDGRPHRAGYCGVLRPKVYSSDGEIADWGCATYAKEGWSWLNAVRRSCLEGAERARFPRGMKLMEDNIFMLKVLPYVHKACQGEIPGYLYRQRPASACIGKRSVQTLVRLFDEAAPLFAAASAGSRRHLSWMLGGAVLEWRKFRDVSEDNGDGIAISCLLDARKALRFRLADVPARWRLGFAAVVFMRTFSILDVLLRSQRLCSDVRRGCTLSRCACGGSECQ